MGIFPMGEEDGSIAWFEASPRAIMPISSPEADINVSRSLKQVIKKNIFEIRIDTAFNQVLNFCAERESTWINDMIKSAYTELHEKGYAHSVEAWHDGELAGGLYGVAYRGAFFGESMFRKVNNASKVCVVELYRILQQNNYILFDIQMMTSHFEQFGAVEISKRRYLDLLEKAMEERCGFQY
ncbi:MAG: leucyl/phenylalanyl-tRNA--protein transferase [Ignavibacteria bacterium]|nr:leucyl/phenylalanyl-tRNA--protein transferase [Ignavibacteria bacterium]